MPSNRTSPSDRSASAGCRPRTSRPRSAWPTRCEVESSGTIVADADRDHGLHYKVWSTLPPLAGRAILRRPDQAATAATPPACGATVTSSSRRRPTSRPSGSRAVEVTAPRRDHAVRAGRGVARLLPRPRQRVRLRHQRRRPRRRSGDPRVPPGQARLLRAVRECVRGDGALARHPGAGRGRVHAGHAPVRRPLPRDQPRRPRVARDLPERAGLDAPLRPHPQQPGRRRRGRQCPPARARGGRRHRHHPAAADRIHGAVDAREHEPGERHALVPEPDAGHTHVGARDHELVVGGRRLVAGPRRARSRWPSWWAATSARCSGSSVVGATGATTPTIPRSRSAGRGPRRSTASTRPTSFPAPRRRRSTSPPPCPTARDRRPRVRCTTSRGVRRGALRRRRARARRRARRVVIGRRARARARRRCVVDATVATPPRSVDAGAPLTHKSLSSDHCDARGLSGTSR